MTLLLAPWWFATTATWTLIALPMLVVHRA